MSATTSSQTSATPTIALVGLAHGISHMHHLLLVPLFPIFLKDFGLSYTELGMLVTVFFTVSGIGQALAGFVVDRLGPLPVLWGSLLCFLLASAAAGAAHSHAGLILAAALAGLGNASFHPIDFSILNQRVPHQRLGQAFAVHGITGNLGWAIAPVLLLGITQLTGHWRMAYVATAALTLCVIVLLWVYQRYLHTESQHAVATKAATHATSHATSSTKPDHPLAFLKIPAVWMCFAFFFWTTAAFGAIQSFASPAISHLYGMPVTTTAMVVTAFMLFGIGGILVGGWAIGRIQQFDAIITAALLLAAVLLALAGSGWVGGWGALALTSMAGFGVGMAGPSRDMLVKQSAPVGATGRVYGLVYSGLDLGFALSAPVFGALLDRGWDASVFWGAALLLVVGVASARQAGARSQPINPVAV